MKKPSLIVDIGPLSCCGSDHVLEFMSKALHDDDHDIWRPHESPHVRDLIETWTKNGIERLGNIRDEFMRRVGVTLRKPPTEPVPKPKLYAGRWNAEEMESVKLYLESLPEEAFALDDWMMVVDYLIQKYLPLDVMMNEAKLQVMRASMMGRVQAHMPDMSAKDAIKLAMELPLSVVALEWEFGMTAAQRAAIEFGQARCCQYVTNVTESVRDKMKHIQRISFADRQARFTGQAAGRFCGAEPRLAAHRPDGNSEQQHERLYCLAAGGCEGKASRDVPRRVLVLSKH